MAVLDLHMVESQPAVMVVLVQDVVDGQCDAVSVVTDQAPVGHGQRVTHTTVGYL